jgi:hypothetical protein
MKADWYWEISLPIILASLLVRTFQKILKLQFNRLMGKIFFMDLASFSFGIRVIIEKLSLQVSNLSSNQASNSFKRSATTKFQ